MNTKNILIVGAGAVGTVYGHYFAKQGHKLSFLVKPSHIAELSNGYYLNELQKNNAPFFVNGYGLETADNISPSTAWDVVVITLSTTALPKLNLSKVNLSAADMVLLSPGLDDVNVMQQKLAGKPFKSLTAGMINLIAFVNSEAQGKAHITLKHPVANTDKLTTCVYFPPTAMPFCDAQAIANGSKEGKSEAAKRVAKLFDNAGIKSKAVSNTLDVTIYPNIFLTVFVLALEAAEWSFAKLAGNQDLLADTAQSIKTLSRVSKNHYDLSSPLHTLVIRPVIIKLGLKIAPSLFSFDIEEYLAHHFTKVGEQSYVHAESYIELAAAQGVTASATQRLLNAARTASA